MDVSPHTPHWRDPANLEAALRQALEHARFYGEREVAGELLSIIQGNAERLGRNARPPTNA